MIDWIIGGRYRLPALLFCYFAIHVAIRWCISDSLSFDESEQAFLTQWNRLGYNSQPPLYTWIQAGLFSIFGYSVLPLAILKNLLLFLTYLLVFGFVLRATNNRRAAVIASLGMLTIPQIAWESHRDLSHTVAVTCATVLLLYCVIQLVQHRCTRWYIALGIATGLGVMSKYNFALTVAAVVAAAATIPNYRRVLIDSRMLLSIVIAAVIVGPHALWIFNNKTLASAKTISQLTSQTPMSWGERVSHGGIDLALSTLGCCVLTLCLFGLCYRNQLLALLRQRSERPASQSNPIATDDAMRLVERFLICIGVFLVVLVVSGGAVNIKNHWLHPFIFLLPTYLTLKFFQLVAKERRPGNQLCIVSALLACLVIGAAIVRPVTAGARGKYSWLNVPYHELAGVVEDQIGDPPLAVFTTDMQTAGNLRLQFPESPVLARESGHLNLEIAMNHRAPTPSVDTRLVNRTQSLPPDLQSTRAVAITDSRIALQRTRLATFAAEQLGLPIPPALQWQTVSFPYRYGRVGDEKEFYFAVIGRTSLEPQIVAPTVPSSRIASNGRSGRTNSRSSSPVIGATRASRTQDSLQGSE